MTNDLIKLLEAFPNKNWEWFSLSSNPNITWEYIRQNLNKKWNWRQLSYNPNITFEIVQKIHIFHGIIQHWPPIQILLWKLSNNILK